VPMIRRGWERLGWDVALMVVGSAHILVGQANDLTGREAEMGEAVARAETIPEDARDARRECHYRRVGPGHRLLKVVVGYNPVPPLGTWIGTVVTAYFVGAVEPKEKPRWP